MKLVEFLQGKWLRHPLHPALVHIPVGAWTAACVLDVVAWAGRPDALAVRVALWCVAVGLVGALVAIPPGVADWSVIKRDKPAWKMGLWHMLLNLFATLVWAVNLGLRLSDDGAVRGVSTPVLLSSVLGTLLLFGGAYVGMLMVFDQGIAVARESKKKWREIAARGGARLPEEK